MSYNQLLDKQTHYGCSLYALLNQVKYDYWVIIPQDIILSTLLYLEKIWVFFPTKWASAPAIYPAIKKYIKFKLWLDFTIEVIVFVSINKNWPKWQLATFVDQTVHKPFVLLEKNCLEMFKNDVSDCTTVGLYLVLINRFV